MKQSNVRLKKKHNNDCNGADYAGAENAGMDISVHNNESYCEERSNTYTEETE